MAAKVVSFELTGPAFLARIRALAASSGNVQYTLHARKRMVERHITDLQVVETLLRGRLIEGPALDIRGNWKATLSRTVAGQNLRVAAALWRGVVVITVY